MNRDILKALCIVAGLMLLSSTLTYELPYHQERIERGLSLVSAFAIGALLFNEDEQEEDRGHGLTSIGLWFGAFAVICFCYTMRVIDDNSDGGGLAVAVVLNFVFDCAISITPHWTYATGTDNIALAIVLAARAHQETFSVRWMYVYFPPFVYLFIGYFVSYRRVHENIRVPAFVRTFLTGAKQGIVAYTIVVELSTHIIDTIDDHSVTYGALAMLSVAGPLTSFVAAPAASSKSRVTPSAVEMRCVPEPPAVLY